MGNGRWRRVWLWLVVCALLAPALAAWPRVAAPVGAVSAWSATAPATVARAAHTATVLDDGTVLVAGGDPTGTAERYDPVADRWLSAGPLAGPRSGHTATLLQDGSVLIVGGVASNAASAGQPALATAERYDPATGRWRVVGALAAPRFEHTATLLRDGRVFVAGGTLVVGGSALASAEIFDPATDRWSPTSPFGTQRARHTATLLGDGRVAIAGGTTNASERAYLNTVELFEPGEGRRSPVPGGFGEARAGHAAALLPDGHLLIAGGASNFEGELRSVEFDLASGAQRFSVPLTTARVRPQAVVLPDGGVALIGGTSSGAPPDAVETYDLTRRIWVGTAPLLTARVDFAAVALPGGELFVSGGVADGAPTRSAERYQPVATPERCFAETGYCVRGSFAAYWEAHGGLALNGYPLSAERVETLEDGQPYTVQYFERTRLEYHPTNPAPYTVLLGQFGRRVLATGAARGQLARVDPLPGATYFAETGHNARGRFLYYWQANGGLAQFGFPVSEEFTETLEDGQPYTVQYFERARFEYHPENAGTPYEVLLGQFGRSIMAQSALLTGAFGYLYLVNEEVRGRLGLPLGPAATVSGATLEFERGRMYYRADQRRIYVLGNLRGDLLGPPGAGASFPDTWREGEPVGGGPGPIAGTFAPRFGFGKVWRENGYLRERLGYALAAEEMSYPLLAQEFARGVLLLSPDGEIVTALYLGEPQPCAPGYNCAPESQGSFQCYRAFNRVQQCDFPAGTPPRVVAAR